MAKSVHFHQYQLSNIRVVSSRSSTSIHSILLPRTQDNDTSWSRAPRLLVMLGFLNVGTAPSYDGLRSLCTSCHCYKRRYPSFAKSMTAPTNRWAPGDADLGKAHAHAIQYSTYVQTKTFFLVPQSTRKHIYRKPGISWDESVRRCYPVNRYYCTVQYRARVLLTATGQEAPGGY